MKNSKNMTKFIVVVLLLSFLTGCSVNNSKNNSINNTTNQNISAENEIESNEVIDTENTTENTDTDIVNEDENANENEKETIKQPTKPNKDEKIAYLTFDDGPSTNVTPEILRILDEYNVKATFFVMGLKAERYPELILEEHNKGHIVANHTYGHDEKYLYASTKNFMNDIYKAENVLKEIISGYDYKLIRFPQGAFQNSKAAHREVVSETGYHYVDWNCINGDYLANTLPTNQIIQQVKDTYRNQKKLIVLMHDSSPKTSTAEGLPEIIEFLRAEGYTFKTLESLTK